MQFGDLASWAGAGISLASAFFSAWWPYHTRPRASFGVIAIPKEKQEFQLEILNLTSWKPIKRDKKPDLMLDIYNNGDEAAFGFTIQVDDGDAVFVTRFPTKPLTTYLEQRYQPQIAPGQHYPVFVWVDKTPSTLSLHWLDTPTRLGHHLCQEIQLSETDVIETGRVRKLKGDQDG